MALGATEYDWRPGVARVAHLVERHFPGVHANTYQDHPWPGWDRVSIDWWWRGGRGDALPARIGDAILPYFWTIPRKPPVRHTIYEHTLWTSFGGVSPWRADDHSGLLRHVHVTFWK